MIYIITYIFLIIAYALSLFISWDKIEHNINKVSNNADNENKNTAIILGLTGFLAPFILFSILCIYILATKSKYNHKSAFISFNSVMLFCSIPVFVSR